MAREQLNTALTWVSHCLKELAANTHSDVVDVAAAAAQDKNDQEVIDWTVACTSPLKLVSSTSSFPADGVSDH